MRLICWLILTIAVVGQAKAQDLEIHVVAGKQVLAPGLNLSPSLAARLITAWRGPAGWRIVQHPVADLPTTQTVLAAVKALAFDPRQPTLAIAILSSRLFFVAGGEQALAIVGANQPFTDIPETLKGRARVRRDKVVWLGVGWIQWRDFEIIRPPGGCAPSFTWERCVVQNALDDFVINQRAGHTGWPLYGAAVVANPGNSAGEADRFMDFIASAKAAEAMRDEFVIVAHPEIRRRRSVAFQMFAAGNGPVLATAIDAPDPLPRPQIDPVTGIFNACGAANTCPNYLPPPGTEAAFHQEVSAALK